MSQNNLNHYSDLSKYKIFEPANTQWPEDVVDVQTALSLIGEWARTDVGLPDATEIVKGVLRVATDDEVDIGESDDTAITPLKLANRLKHPEATETVLGLTQYATNEEAAELKANNRSIVASSLGYVFDNVNANEARFGTVKLSSQGQALAGTDNTSATTPARVVEMIGKFAPVAPEYSPATETSTGLVQLATLGQTASGTLRSGFAISPYSFVNTRATETQVGTTKIATIQEINQGSSNQTAISPLGLMSFKAGDQKYGIVKTVTGYSTDRSAVLAASSPVVYTSRTINGQSLANNINLTAANVGAWTTAQSDARYLLKSQGGNWCRNYISRGSPTQSLEVKTTLPVAGTATLSISAFFDFNNDSSTNRYYTFQIRVNNVIQQTQTLRAYVQKGGSSGHKWKFEGCVTNYFAVSCPAEATVTIVPVDNYKASSISYQLSVNN